MDDMGGMSMQTVGTQMAGSKAVSAPRALAGGSGSSRSLLSVRVAALIIVVCQLGDVLSTHALLGAGGVEANPLAKFLLAWGWLGVAKIGLAALLCVRFGLRRAVPLGIVAMTWAVAGFYVAVVVGNLLTLRLVA